MTPGTHPKHVRAETISIDPHPLSNTDKGGKIRHTITRDKLIKCISMTFVNI